MVVLGVQKCMCALIFGGGFGFMDRYACFIVCILYKHLNFGRGFGFMDGYVCFIVCVRI